MRQGSKMRWDMLLAGFDMYVLLAVALVLAAAYVVRSILE
jgi:hypothetical protein